MISGIHKTLKIEIDVNKYPKWTLEIEKEKKRRFLKYKWKNEKKVFEIRWQQQGRQKMLRTPQWWWREKKGLCRDETEMKV